MNIFLQSSRVFFRKIPIDVNAKTGLVVHVHVAVAHLRAVAEETVPDRIAVGRTVRFDCETGARKRGDQMAMHFRRERGWIKCL